MDGITRSRVGLSRSPQLMGQHGKNKTDIDIISIYRHQTSMYLKPFLVPLLVSTNHVVGKLKLLVSLFCIGHTYLWLLIAPSVRHHSSPTSAFCPSCCQITSFFSHFFLGSSVMGFSNGLPGTKIRHAAKNQPCFLVQSWSKEISDPVYYVVQ